jgi:hypothetical protein
MTDLLERLHKREFGDLWGDFQAVDEAIAEITRLRAQRDNREMLFEMAKKDVEKLIAQRDQLLAALKDIVDAYEPDLDGTHYLENALAAITAVEDTA